MTTNSLTQLLTEQSNPTDTAIIRACLQRSYGRHFTTLTAMYFSFRAMLDEAGYTGGLASGPQSISAVTQYYQPIDKQGDLVRGYEITRALEDDILIHTSVHGYTVAHTKAS